jgi:RNA-binding protein
MQDLKPTVWIGKQGCTETMIEEITSQLRKRKLIKVKWLQNTEVDPEAIAAQAKARLVEVRGRTMVLADKGKGAIVTPKNAAKAPAKTARKPPVKVTAKAMGRLEAVRSPSKKPAKPPAHDDAPGKPRQTGALKRSGK